MTTLKYSTGAEIGVVVENEGFAGSIFSEQYKSALRLIDRYVEIDNSSDTGSDKLKTVSFCGNRGDGKTSCMNTVLNILKHSQDNNAVGNEYVDYLHEPSLGLKNICKLKFECLKVIDPSFFDTKHNVLELMISQMYVSVKERSDYAKCGDLLKRFAEVKRCVDNIHKVSEEKWDEVQEIDEIASGVELRVYLSLLIKEYLHYKEKDVLVMSIDDIDLNMSQAYAMCEHIRKYLALPNCIVLLAVKLDQLENVVCGAMMEVGKGYADEAEYHNMARKYVEKLLPASCHVNMPKIYGMANVMLKISGAENVPVDKDVKTALVELIFRRTGYLFYNSKGGVSPIVPNNLRTLMHLLGLLVPMKDRQDKAAHKINQNAFKEYFYKEWTQALDDNDKKNVQQLLSTESDTAVNKQAVACLKSVTDKYHDRNYLEWEEGEAKPESLGDYIVDPANFGYNVSVGDVFYLIYQLEQDVLTASQARLVFFVKSFYSMRLYEAYDEIIDDINNNLYPENEPNGLYKEDARFSHTNALQRLVGGSFFTYDVGELISRQSSDRSFDKRVIDNKALGRLLGDLQKERQESADNDEFKRLFNLAEFFILTTSGTVSPESEGNLSTHQKRFRKNVEAHPLQSYNKDRGFSIFDALSIFANIVNPQFAYSKYNGRFEELYDYALSHDFSLLKKMVDKADTVRRYSSNDVVDSGKVHSLLSDAIIRNADVLSAMFELVKSNRRKGHDAVEIKNIARILSVVQRSGMKTYSRSNENGPYDIKFDFLQPIVGFINEIAVDNGKLKNKWNEIFEMTVMNAVENLQDLTEIVRGKSKPSKIRCAIKNANIEELRKDDLKELVPDNNGGDKAYTKEQKQDVLNRVWTYIAQSRNKIIGKDDLSQQNNVVAQE